MESEFTWDEVVIRLLFIVSAILFIAFGFEKFYWAMPVLAMLVVVCIKEEIEDGRY